MSIRRMMMHSFGGLAEVPFPTLYGTVDVWLDPGDVYSLTIGTGNKVSQIANKAEDTSKNFVMATTGNQGVYTENQLNERPVLKDFVGYTSGDTSSYKYMHDRSMAYGIFDVYSINTGAVGSDVINSTTDGGNTNGMFIFPYGTLGLRKTIRQADSGGTTSTDIIGAISGNNIYSLNTFFMLSDVYFGYQVTGNDYEMSINNNSPAATQADSTTCSLPSLNHNYAYNMGLHGGLHSLGEKIIVKWPTQTRSQIIEDITAIKTYFNTKFNLW